MRMHQRQSRRRNPCPGWTRCPDNGGIGCGVNLGMAQPCKISTARLAIIYLGTLDRVILSETENRHLPPPHRLLPLFLKHEVGHEAKAWDDFEKLRCGLQAALGLRRRRVTSIDSRSSDSHYMTCKYRGPTRVTSWQEGLWLCSECVSHCY